jgi:hypothetical protein
VRLYIGAVWINIGNQITDESGYECHAIINGDPILIDGTPFDPGIVDGASNTKSLAVRLNRPTSELVNREWLEIPDNAGFQQTGITTGFSVFLRFRVQTLATQNGASLTLYSKVDDATPANGFMLKAMSDGKLVIHVLRSGTDTIKETAAGTIVVNTVYDLWMTFTVTGPVIHLYVNNVDKTLTTSADVPNWALGDTDIHVFRRGNGSSGGYLYGDFYSMMFYRHKILSSTEVANHFTNKFTTANIPLGQVLISNYSAT